MTNHSGGYEYDGRISKHKIHFCKTVQRIVKQDTNVSYKIYNVLYAE